MNDRHMHTYIHACIQKCPYIYDCMHNPLSYKAQLQNIFLPLMKSIKHEMRLEKNIACKMGSKYKESTKMSFFMPSVLKVKVLFSFIK